jgi:serine/threonine protein phosphatase PrpC
MINTKEYIEKLFTGNSITIDTTNKELFEKFILDEQINESVQLIFNQQKSIMENWKIKESINFIINNHIQIPNGTVGKDYDYRFDFYQLNWNNIIFSEFEGLDEIGLIYDKDEERIYGNPTISGDLKIKIKFRVKGENDNSILNEKPINLIINADPKSLWQNKESDKTDKFWKEDNINTFDKLGAKKIVVSSKRGRSHANVGSFRDDDFAFHHFEKNGWSIVAVSDGAGSAKNSRKGSQISCNEVVNYFDENFNNEIVTNFDQLINEHYKNSTKNPKEKSTLIEEDKINESISQVEIETNDKDIEKVEVVEIKESSQVQISKFIYNYLGGCAKHVYNKLDEFANENEFPIKELHSTLIFTLLKKYEFGYVILSFGVGDCPIAIINKDYTDFKLMNWLDVGEFGGGTRFITMPEIFTNEKFATRFGFKIIEDFSFLFLMTDGIYDAKFVVEANLEKLEKWKEFIDDLKGNNEDNSLVEFEESNKDIANQLSAWMDFWSPGNHDDRTLAIVF